MNLPDSVTIEDVTLRDGLQNEARLFSVEEKLDIARRLMAAGIRRLQIGAFVRPKQVPQMADTSEFFSALPKDKGVTYTALILNERGLDRALEVGVSHLYVAISASETHSRKNSHCSLSEALERVTAIIKRAKGKGSRVRAGVMVAFGCPYEGPIPSSKVLDIVKAYKDLKVDIIDLADTAGLANPQAVFGLCRAAQSLSGRIPISLHLHDTRGLGLANLLAGLQAGIRLFDASTGGQGGCPFIPHASGNIATEDAVYMLKEMGIKTGIDVQSLCVTTHHLEKILGRSLPSKQSSISRRSP